MTVSVLVPYRGDNGGPRDAALAYVERWWGEHHPAWQFVCGYHIDGPWVKARAVADGLRDATGDILVIADGDVICNGVAASVTVVASGADPWAVPHTRVHRLTDAGTSMLLAGGPLPARDRDASPRTPLPLALVAEAYTGVLGGGLLVLPRELYDQVPIDPRFRGWGNEDLAHARALSVIAGPPRRGGADLWHLWHPPAARMTRAVGSRESLALYQRYLSARTPVDMAALLAGMSDAEPSTALAG